MNKRLVYFLLICVLILSCFSGASKLSNTTLISDQQKYVIITTIELVDSVSQLQVWKEYLGFSVDVVTISWIASEYPGQDLQEQIRNYLIDSYEEGTPLYVLLVGTRETIPMRTCHPIPWEFPDHLETDWYYADLTGDWNTDGDEYFGEYEQDQVDFTAEASVGRIPSDDPLLVRSICHNVIRYENDAGDWKRNLLSLAAIIYYENMTAFNWTYERSDGATLTEECWNDIFQPEGYTHVCMYEKDGIRPSTYECDFPLTHENVRSEWTNGYGIVNMLGHSLEMKVSRFIWDHDDGDEIPEFEGGELIYIDFLRFADGADLKGEMLPIVYSAGCSQFHSVRNMGKEFLEQGAAVAYIGTTDISFYNITRVWYDERDGGAFSLDYYFFYYLVTEAMKCGDALAASKSYFVDHFMVTEYDPDWIYRCYSTLYGFTLFGDPALGMTTEMIDPTPPTLTIDAPRGHLYLFGRSLLPLPLGVTIALGDVPVVASASDEESGIAGIEVWINNVVQTATVNDTINWVWDEPVVGRRIIQIVASDVVGNRVEEETPVWVINLNLV
jgi:hypothetical protein